MFGLKMGNFEAQFEVIWHGEPVKAPLQVWIRAILLSLPQDQIDEAVAHVKNLMAAEKKRLAELEDEQSGASAADHEEVEG